MALILISLALTVTGIVLYFKYDCENDCLSVLGIVIGGIGEISLLLILIALPICQTMTKSYAIQYESVKNSIKDSRLHGCSEIERAALTTKIIDINSDIAVAQYWNKTIFNILIHDSVMDLLPLK